MSQAAASHRTLDVGTLCTTSSTSRQITQMGRPTCRLCCVRESSFFSVHVPEEKSFACHCCAVPRPRETGPTRIRLQSHHALVRVDGVVNQYQINQFVRACFHTSRPSCLTGQTHCNTEYSAHEKTVVCCCMKNKIKYAHVCVKSAAAVVQYSRPHRVQYVLPVRCVCKYP